MGNALQKWAAEKVDEIESALPHEGSLSLEEAVAISAELSHRIMLTVENERPEVDAYGFINYPRLVKE